MVGQNQCIESLYLEYNSNGQPSLLELKLISINEIDPNIRGDCNHLYITIDDTMKEDFQESDLGLEDWLSILKLVYAELKEDIHK